MTCEFKRMAYNQRRDKETIIDEISPPQRKCTNGAFNAIRLAFIARFFRHRIADAEEVFQVLLVEVAGEAFFAEHIV
ncbi:hypothetical protein BH11VER1_BH11VER1_14950 [soil metagenome]